MKSMIAVMALVGGGCAVSTFEDEDDDELDDDTAELSTTKDTFLIARHDLRRCISPVCGGYWVKDLNSTMQERYVSAYEFDASISEDVREQVTSAPDLEVVLFGRLGPKENVYKTRTLRVNAAYRGMPGMTVLDGDKFYQVTPTRIACVTNEPCKYLLTTRVNRTTGHTMASDVSVEDALATMVDGAWLHARVITGRAVVSGRVVRAQGHVTVEANQVFVALPERVAACPPPPAEACPSDMIQAFDRTTDRCTVETGCTLPGVCAPFTPACDPGYTLIRWQDVCPRFACEPAFLP